jgi:ParB family transcriptional regulator, chromosome partitioning protein|nr:MAG TPA: chromosome partitioning protein [Caudoviricetes sp.]
MAEFKRLPLDKILIGDRLREIDPEHAKVIGLSMQEHGQITPITVRSTPRASLPYTLVGGGHRYVGAGLIDWTEIDTMVVKADGIEAQLLEVAENLHRYDLTVMDRAFFVMKYREIWEESRGKIERGGDRKSKGKLCPLIDGSFAQHVADQLGIANRSAKLLDQISRNLHPELRSIVRGTSAANNQSELLKLSRLAPSKQRQVAIALRDEFDVKRAFSLVNDAPATVTIDPQVTLLSKLIDAWRRSDSATKQQFLDHIGMSVELGDVA